MVCRSWPPPRSYAALRALEAAAQPPPDKARCPSPAFLPASLASLPPRCADVLTNCFRALLALGTQGELVQAAYLACSRIAPDYAPGAQLNIGGG